MELRWKVLDELVSIPKKFDMPVVMGFVPKGKLRGDYQSIEQRDVDLAAHVIAFTIALLSANMYMKRGAAPEEMASVTVENSDHARMLIKTVHDFIRDPAQVAALDAETAKHLPLDRIVESDAVAFSIMRRLRRGRNCERFYDPLEHLIIARPNFAVLDTLVPGEWHEKLDGGESDSG